MIIKHRGNYAREHFCQHLFYITNQVTFQIIEIGSGQIIKLLYTLIIRPLPISITLGALFSFGLKFKPNQKFNIIKVKQFSSICKE